MRDPRYDILFQPVRIGPVTAPNRFYQVPHCTGMGYLRPHTLAAMREIKAEGGWGVVNTEYCSIDPTSDDTPHPHASLWDEGDVRNMAVLTDGIHRHGALAGVELWHGGLRPANGLSRRTGVAPVSLPVQVDPWQTKAMDRADIRDYRVSHRAAALRARAAGFDIVYVYAAHAYLLAQLLDPKLNQRTDEYGGSIVNRSRLVREVLAETRDAIGETCAIAIRIEVDDEAGPSEDRLALLDMLKDEADLFDVTICDYSQEMGVSRFIKEASLAEHIKHVRTIVKKPVVSVGRFTSPDTMVAQIRQGIVDLIGAARPSIADPFLPRKIREGRSDDIRECIGCNICYSGDGRGVPIRCTQNPTMGEEWRRGWHPENVKPAPGREAALVVGAGPAGLEAALTLARRGYTVTLAEASGELGGRVSRECRLPGLSEWGRVRDWRVHQLGKLANVAIYRGSAMSADDIRGFGAAHVLIATGSRWRKDGRGRGQVTSVASFADARVFSPDDIMDGLRPEGPVIVYDDDRYYMASVIAELLAKEGRTVTYITTEGIVAWWSRNTAEQTRTHMRLAELGVHIIVNRAVTGLDAKGVQTACIYTNAVAHTDCGGLVLVTSREPNDALYHALKDDPAFASVSAIGDCRAPGIIAQAVYAGHEAGRLLGADEADRQFRRDRVLIGA
ncbi:MAG: FAD-dependent oxidoreductase [Hyphomicrobiales bacterium]